MITFGLHADESIERDEEFCKNSLQKTKAIWELAAVICFGIGHVLLEVFSDGVSGGAGSITRPQHLYNIAAFIIWGVYLLWQVAKVRGIAQEWGFRREGFMQAMK